MINKNNWLIVLVIAILFGSLGFIYERNSVSKRKCLLAEIKAFTQFVDIVEKM